MRRRVLFLSIALLLPACNGGTVDQHALDNDSASIDSLACEGALLAHQVVEGDALSQRPTTPGIESAVRKEAEKAGRVADLLHQLEANDAESAAALKGRLEQEGDCA
jgi:hypothetical protein